MARLLEAADVAPAAAFVPMEVTLRALGQGFNAHDALRTYFTLVSQSASQVASSSYKGKMPVAGSDGPKSERQRNALARVARFCKLVRSLTIEDTARLDVNYCSGANTARQTTTQTPTSTTRVIIESSTLARM